MRMFTLVSAAIVAASCAEGDREAQEPATAQDTARQLTGTPAATPAEDPNVQTIDATLTEWSVTLSRDSVPAGVLAINVRNAGTVPHALEVEGGGQEMETPILQPGGDVTLSLNLTAGTYEVYCPVDTAGVNHKARGMTTRLRVY